MGIIAPSALWSSSPLIGPRALYICMKGHVSSNRFGGLEARGWRGGRIVPLRLRREFPRSSTIAEGSVLLVE